MSVVTTGQITVTDQNDGVSARLTLESFVAPTAPDGSSPVLTGASTTVTVFLGTTDDSSNWTVVASPSSGVTGSLSSRTYTVSGLTVDAGYVDLTASRSGYSSVTMRFAVSKAKKGNRGTVSAARAISGTAWSDSEAAAAITAVASDSPVQGDVVTLYNSASAYSETRQRGASSWSTLTKYLNGNLVVDGTVSASAIAADAITASKMLIEDNSNIVPDADYEDAAAWGLDSANTTETVVAATSEWNSANLLQVDAASNVVGIVRGKTFKVRPGDKLFWEGQLMVNGGTGNCYVQIQYSASRNMSSPVTTNTAIVSATTPTALSGEITVPSGVRFARVRLVKNSNGTTSALFGRFVLRKKADAELIVDGAIVAAKIAADAVEADKIKAGAITTTKLSIGDTSNMVPNDWSTGNLDGWNVTFNDGFVNDTGLGSAAGWRLETRSRDVSPSTFVAVTRDEQYYLSAWVYNTDTTRAQLILHLQTQNGTTNTYPVAAFTDAKNTWAFLEGTVLVPANYTKAKIILQTNRTDGVGTFTRWSKPVMRRAAAGKLIVDGSITADKIDTDAVVAGKIAAGAVNAREITANAITTDKMAIRSFNNLIENPDFENGTLHWTNPTRILNDPENALRGSWVYTYVSASSANAFVSRSNYVEALPGDSFYVRGSFKNSAGSTGNFYIEARFYDSANATISTPRLTWAGENTSWSEKEMIVTAPANAVRMTVNLYTAGVGTAYWDGISLMKAAEGKLIVDGSITANKIQTGAIIADKISANSITVSKILVQDNSNLVPDADFEDPDVWATITGTRVIATAPSGWDSTNVLKVSGAAGEIVGTVGKPFRIRAGDTLAIEAQFAVTGGVIGAAAAEVYLLTSAKRDMSSAVAVSSMSTASNTPVTQKSTFVVPSGIRFAQVFVRKLAGSVTEVTLGRIVVRNRSTTDLLEDNAVSTIREVTINNTATITAGAGWVTHGSYTFTPSGSYPISLWMTGKGSITLPAGVFGSLDVRIYWRGVLTFTYTGSLSGTGAQTLTGLVTANDRFESGGGTSGTLEVQVRANGANCQFTAVRILLGEFKK